MPFSIEGERVWIRKDNCEVVIENAGLEDDGDWEFTIMTKKSHKLFLNFYKATVKVQGKRYKNLIMQNFKNFKSSKPTIDISYGTIFV